MKNFKKLSVFLLLFILFFSFSQQGLAKAFSDLSEKDPYAQAINFLLEEKIVNGNPDGTFKPLALVNRAEILKVAIEALTKISNKQIILGEVYDKQCYKDVFPGKWYTKYICYAKAQNIVQGYSDGSFHPSQKVTYAEALKIVFKTFNLPYNEKSEPWYKSLIKSAEEMQFNPLTVEVFYQELKRNEMAQLLSLVVKHQQSKIVREPENEENDHKTTGGGGSGNNQDNDQEDTDTGGSPSGSPTPGNLPSDPGSSLQTVQPYKIAFTADQGNSKDTVAVLQLVKNEKVDLIILSGDFDYKDSPKNWDSLNTETLGTDAKILASIGHHEIPNLQGYLAILQQKLTKLPNFKCSGEIGTKHSCTYGDFTFVFTAPDIVGEGYDTYIKNTFANSKSIWNICSMHNRLEPFKPATKSAQQECLNAGAIIATGHNHIYARSPLLNGISKENVVTKTSPITIEKGKTFTFMSGLGGKSIDPLQGTWQGTKDWWTKVYGADENAKSGALFCTFGVNNIRNQADCYFKNIDGDVIDNFTIISKVNSDIVIENPPTPTPTPSPETNPNPAPNPTPSPNPVPPVVPTASNQNSPLGTNIGQPSYWGSEWHFIDVFKNSGGWYTANDSTWDTLEQGKLNLDQDGWVKSLPKPGDNVKYNYVTASIAAASQDSPDKYPIGQYTVLYDGQGTIKYQFAGKVISSTTGKDVLDVTSMGSIILKITSTDPQNNGDYIRNIRVIMPGGICNNDPTKYAKDVASCSGTFTSFVDNYQTQKFHPLFLENIKPFKVLRFMDFFDVNHSTISQWSKRPEITDARWVSGSGSPVELAIDISNYVAADPWLNTPIKADDDYIKNFAQLTKQKLGQNQKVYIELGNELWNGGFAIEQNYAIAQAKNTWGSATEDDYHKALNWYAMRSVQMCEIWKQEWGTDSGRVKCVLAGQAAGHGTNEEILSCPLWVKNGGKKCSANVDYFATAPYFGINFNKNNVDQLRSIIQESDGGFSTIFNDIFSGGKLVQKSFLQESFDWMKDNVTHAKSHGLKLITYEGGQHFTIRPELHNESDATTLSKFLASVNRDNRMQQAYNQYFNKWKELGGELFVHYTSSTPYNKHGYWGAVESQINNDMPKYNALIDFINKNPIWW